MPFMAPVTGFGAIKWGAEKIKFYNILLTLIKNFQL